MTSGASRRGRPPAATAGRETPDGPTLRVAVGATDDGAGYGLDTVAEIAEAHGWRVGAEESAAGGARFAAETAPAATQA